LHNAWFYYLEARSLISPLSFMSTLATDRLYDESQSLQPADLPAAGKSITLTIGTATYKLTAAFPEAVGNDLDLIVRYESANVANTSLAYQENVNVMKALVAKIPEVRDAFAAVVARAVDTSGHDYGTLLAMKDIK
jgi:phage tail sheath gpL-like